MAKKKSRKKLKRNIKIPQRQKSKGSKLSKVKKLIALSKKRKKK